jgi:drug/metabolite transporter (DMT)-like permease
MSAIVANPPLARLDTTTMTAVAVTVVAWASAFPSIRAGLAAFGPAELGAMRFGIAAIPAAIFLAVARPSLPSWSEAWRFAFGGIVFVALYTTLLNFGEVTVSAGAASFIINVSPIMVALMAAAMMMMR